MVVKDGTVTVVDHVFNESAECLMVFSRNAGASASVQHMTRKRTPLGAGLGLLPGPQDISSAWMDAIMT